MIACKPRDSVTELSLDKRAKVLEETCSVWRTLNDKQEIQAVRELVSYRLFSRTGLVAK